MQPMARLGDLVDGRGFRARIPKRRKEASPSGAYHIIYPYKSWTLRWADHLLPALHDLRSHKQW